jgi:regulator of protease activity HflC (stomatin/prohibitin superfamily)
MSFSAIFTIVGWGLLIGLGLYVFYVLSMRSQRRPVKLSAVIVTLLLVGGIVMIVVGAGLVFIPAEERGVVISVISGGGLRSEPLEPGLHWIVPFAETVETYSIANQNYTMSISPGEGVIRGDDSIEARTSDGQQVKIDASVIFRVNPAKTIDVHIKWKDRYVDGAIRPAARGILRDVVSQFNVEEVYSTKRDEVTNEIRERMAVALDTQGLELVTFILRNVAFTEEYANSIERKQIAEQEALRAKFLVDQQKQEAERLREEARGQRDAVITKAEGDAQAIVLRAKADADALRLIADALQTNQDLLTYTYIQKLAPNVGVIMLPSGGQTPFIFDLKDLQSQALPAPVPTVAPAAPTPPTATP